MKTKIHQIYYDESQKPELDPAFIPYNNQGKGYPYNFEYAVFFDLYEKTNWDETDLLGTVSWKFRQKTGLNGLDFLSVIKSNPGYDVYFINPFPELSIYKNVWIQGNKYHANFIDVTSKFFDACGISTDILDAETPPNLTAYCNYWVANKQFWDDYISFIRPLWNFIKKNEGALNSALQSQADAFIKAPYTPFIFERLFSTFLTSGRFKALTIPTSRTHRRGFRFITPLWLSILNVIKLNNHDQISFRDKSIIWTFLKVSRLRSYITLLIK